MRWSLRKSEPNSDPKLSRDEKRGDLVPHQTNQSLSDTRSVKSGRSDAGSSHVDFYPHQI